MLLLFIFLNEQIIYTYPTTYSLMLSAGKYTFKLYGASGGRPYHNGHLYGTPGGQGAYVYGTTTITGTGTLFYINVGGKGGEKLAGESPGGFNGGGMSGKDISYAIPYHGDDGCGGGGGATDIRIYNNSLSNRVMVAAGGSGAANTCKGAPGGTIFGVKPIKNNNFVYTLYVSQNSGTLDGVGEKGRDDKYIAGSGAGGGWRGGISSNGYSYWDWDNYKSVASSGSSYISGFLFCALNPNIYFTNMGMKRGDEKDQSDYSDDGKAIIEIIFKCPSNCSECESGTKCTKCFDGYFLNDNGKECIKKCKSGFVGLDGKCQKCTSNCEECTEKVSKCTSCLTGYFLYKNKCVDECIVNYAGVNKKCEQCKPPCKDCSNAINNCTSCLEGYLFKNECKQNCPSGFIGINRKCEPCLENCLKCKDYVTYCTECKSGFYLYHNECLKECPKGYYKNANRCSKCKDECAECSSYDSCTSCTNGILSSGICVPKCQTNQYFNNGGCNECDISCNQCMSSPSTCISCKPNQKLKNNKCVDACTNNYYEIDGKCEQCKQNCDSCKFSATTCFSCKNGFYLHNNQCKKECPSNYVGIKQKCEQCKAPCLECTGLTTKCKSCISGYFLYNNECKPECPGHLYGSKRKCYECNETCLKCESTASTCTSCPFGSNLIGSECVSICPKDMTSVNGECQKCTSNCYTCENETSTCMSCSGQLNLINHKCEEKCPEGTTSIENVCVKCESPCSECITSKNMCTSCEENYFYYENEYKCYKQCPNGTIQNGTFCIACDISCKECENYVDQCTICQDNYYGFNDHCYSQCTLLNNPDNNEYYGNDDENLICKRCLESPCLDCSFDYKNCTVCDEHHVVQDWECYPPDYVILENWNCSMRPRCNYSVHKMKSVQVYVLVSSFNNKDQKLPGGAFYIINCAVSCNYTSFENCTSHGAGGAIYIKNYKNLSNNVDFQGLVFIKCKACYGGAVYIYSNQEHNNVSFIECNFFNNELDSEYDKDKNKVLRGGTALFLTSQQAKIKKCTFKDNQGQSSAVKIYNNFNDPKNDVENIRRSISNIENYENNVILIVDCQITISSKEKSGIYIEGKDMSNVFIKECNFTGKLAKGAKYIDGKMIPRNAKKVQVSDCQFEYKGKSFMSIEVLKDDED